MRKPLFFLLFCLLWACSSDKNLNQIPVIYISDLYHPYEDLDDHFDAASIYSIPEFDIQGIIIDNAKQKEKTPGLIPIRQLNKITGKNPPVYVGLKNPLLSVGDTGENQSGFQDGTNAIIRHLEDCSGKALIISVGSVRDISAAYNRRPDLFEEKVDKLIIFIGEASRKDKIEYNVSLDRLAYQNVMNNMPNVFWVPCFDGGTWKNKGKASFWQAHHADLLEGASDRILNFFIYAATRSTDTLNYINYLDQDVNQHDLQSEILDTTKPQRRLWCCAVFPHFVTAPETSFPFSFEPVSVTVDSLGVLEYSKSGNRVMQFFVTDQSSYDRRMTINFNSLIKSLQ